MRKEKIGYTHHLNFLKDFFKIFKEPSKSVLMKDTRPNLNNRYCDTFCIFKNGSGLCIVVTLKESGEYFEMINIFPANLWQREIFDNKEKLRQEEENN